MREKVTSNKFDHRKVAIMENNELSAPSTHSQKNGVMFTKEKGEFCTKSLGKLWRIIQGVLKKVLCGLSCFKKNSHSEQSTFPNEKLETGGPTDSPNIQWENNTSRVNNSHLDTNTSPNQDPSHPNPHDPPRILDPSTSHNQDPTHPNPHDSLRTLDPNTAPNLESINAQVSSAVSSIIRKNLKDRILQERELEDHLSRIPIDDTCKQHVYSCKKELEEISEMVASDEYTSKEKLEAMDEKFLNENPFRLDDSTKTSDIPSLLLNKYNFDDNTLNFLNQLIENKDHYCEKLANDFKNKIDIYKSYTHTDTTEKISLLEILLRGGYNKVCSAMVLHQKSKSEKLWNMMSNLLENMQAGDRTPWKENFIKIFVMYYGLASNVFLPLNSTIREASVSDIINTSNGNSLLMELIRLGYYELVFYVSQPCLSGIDAIYAFKNINGKNAFNLIEDALKEKQGIENEINKLKIVQNYLHIKNTQNLSEDNFFSNRNKIMLVRDIMNISLGKNQEPKNFSLPQKKFFLQKLSLAGIHLSSIYDSKSPTLSIFFSLLENTQVSAEDFIQVLDAFPQAIYTVYARQESRRYFLYDFLYASIDFNRLDIVQLLLKRPRPTELFLWRSPLECALESENLNDNAMCAMCSLLLADEKQKRNAEDYKKIVNDFFGAVIRSGKKAVFDLVLHQESDWIDLQKALEVCTECKDFDKMFQDITDAINTRTSEEI